MVVFTYKYRMFISPDRPTLSNNNEMVPYSAGQHTNTKWSFIFVTLCSIFFGLQNICTGIYLIKYNGTNDNLSTFIWFGVKLITVDCGKISTYCFLLNMLYYTFEDSPFAISLCVYIVYFISVSLFSIRPLSIIAIGVYDLYTDGNEEINDFKINIDFISVLCAITMGFIISTTLLVLFIRKLYQFGIVVTAQYNAKKKSVSRWSKQIDLKQNLEEDIRDLSMKASKTFILGSIIMILSQINWTVTLITQIDKTPSVWNIISFSMDFIGSLTEPLFLMLTFSFMESWYKCCCNIFDTCIKDFGINKMHKNANTDGDDMLEYLVANAKKSASKSVKLNT